MIDADETATVERAVDELLREHPPRRTPVVEFLGAQFDAGLSVVHLPSGCGGLGLHPSLHALVVERLYHAGAPSAHLRNPIGVGMAAPTIAHHAHEDVRRRLLRPLFTSEELWCQLFSEPGAGSDLAGLATAARRDGDEWVVSGQKVWTSMAHVARWGLLLARSDPSKPKHAGLTCFALDMRSEGVHIRGLRQLTGDAEFNEVFFDDVRVPDTCRIGPIDDGWRVATTTLMYERFANSPIIGARGSGAVREAMRLYDRAGRPAGAIRDRVVQAWSSAEVNRLTAMRAAEARRQGTAGPEGSIGKLAASESNKALMRLVNDLLAARGMLFPSYDVARPSSREEWDVTAAVGAAGVLSDTYELPATPPPPLSDDDLQRGFLRSVANTIEAGSSEIMRNIVGERVLGLPGDVRVDRDVPWNESARR